MANLQKPLSYFDPTRVEKLKEKWYTGKMHNEFDHDISENATMDNCYEIRGKLFTFTKHGPKKSFEEKANQYNEVWIRHRLNWEVVAEYRLSFTDENLFLQKFVYPKYGNNW